MDQQSSSLLWLFIEPILTSILGFFTLAGISMAAMWFIGGPQLAFGTLGFYFRIFLKAVQIVGGVLVFVFRRFFFVSKDYVQDGNNKDMVWNLAGAGLLLVSLWYLFETPSVIMDVYNYRDDGWLILGSIGLFAIKGKQVIGSAPFLRTNQALQIYSELLATVITGLTSSSAAVHLTLYFLYDDLPRAALLISLMIYLGFIGYGGYRLVTINAVSTLSRLETAITKTDTEHEEVPTLKADIVLAQSEPTMIKPSEPLVIPEVSRYQHLQVIGPTGTGKSILANNLAVQDLLNLNIGVVALEPTKDFTRNLRNICKKTGRKYYLVDPTDPNTVVINPLDGDDMDEVAEINVGAFIGHLGPNANEFYKNKQKNALRMAIKVAKTIKRDDATYDDLLEILRPNKSSSDLRNQYIKQIKDETIRKDLEEYQEELTNPKMMHQAVQNYNGLYDFLRELTANRYLRRVLCAKSTVSLREIFNNGDVLLVTTAYGKLKQLGFVLGRLVITMLQSETFARTELEEDVRDQLPPMAIYIDEVQNYVSEPFAEIFEMARKAKLMMNIFHQGLAQLRRISERLEQTIFDNARQKVIFGGTNIEDCKMFADKIGELYKKVTSTSVGLFDPLSISHSRREELRLKMTPSEIHKLPGFNTDTFEPAKVLCLLVIHNVIKDEQIGLIAPLPKDVFRDIDILEKSIDDDNENNAPKQPIEHNFNDVDLKMTYTENNKNDNYSSNQEERGEELITPKDPSEVSSSNPDYEPQNDPTHSAKKVRKRRGKRKSNPIGVPMDRSNDNDEILNDDLMNESNDNDNDGDLSGTDDGVDKVHDEDLLLLLEEK